MHHTTQKYINAKQVKTESLTNYYKRFKTIVEVLDNYSANIWSHQSLIPKEYQKHQQTEMTIDEIQDNWNKYIKHNQRVKNRAVAYAFLRKAIHNQYGNLVYNLKNKYSRQIDQYCCTSGMIG